MVLSVAEALHGIAGTEERSRQFAEYWDGLPKVDLIPRRSSFRPEHLPRILPHILIHELLSPEFIRLRLAGSAVVADYGVEITGRNYLDFVEEPRRPKASHAIHAICRQPAAMLVQLRARTRYGRLMMRESVAFPMRDEDGVARLIYFCSSPARERDVFTEPEPDSLQFMDVARRVYFDIGAGLPEHRD